MLIRWDDGGEQWVTLRKTNEVYSVQMAQYAASRGVLYEQEFHWRGSYALKKCDVILSSIRARGNETNHKYGVQIPMSISEAIILDRENKNRTKPTTWIY